MQICLYETLNIISRLLHTHRFRKTSWTIVVFCSKCLWSGTSPLAPALVQTERTHTTEVSPSGACVMVSSI